jgi:hypothetical protein
MDSRGIVGLVGLVGLIGLMGGGKTLEEIPLEHYFIISCYDHWYPFVFGANLLLVNQ